MVDEANVRDTAGRLVEVKSVGVAEWHGKHALSVDTPEGLLVLAVSPALLQGFKIAADELLTRATNPQAVVMGSATLQDVGTATSGNVLHLALATDRWGTIALRMASRETLTKLRTVADRMLGATQ